MTNPEQSARVHIDELLTAAGWAVQDRSRVNLSAARGVAVREFPLATGFADYLLFVDRQAIGAVEAKAVGTPLSGIEPQSGKYSYKITGKSWINNHAHVLRPTGAVDVGFLHYSSAHYPFTPLTTGTTHRRKLTQFALKTPLYPLSLFPEQYGIVTEIERRRSVVEDVAAAVTINLARAGRLRQAVLKRAFEGRLVAHEPSG